MALASLLAVSIALAEPDDAPPAGATVAAELRHAAYRLPGVPSVIVHAPAGFNARGRLHLVVFLHGYNGCVSVLMGEGESYCRPNGAPSEGWDLGAHHDAAQTNTLFVVPQLAFMQRNGRPGAFAQHGVFRAFLEELLAGPLARLLGGPRRLSDVASIDLVAHSAGYQAALAILEHGAISGLVKNVVLFDALYGETPRFARYVENHAGSGLHFVSIALERGIPQRENQVLLRRLRKSLGRERVVSAQAAELVEAIAKHPIVFAVGTPPHRLVPAHHLSEVLRALHPNLPL